MNLNLDDLLQQDIYNDSLIDYMYVTQEDYRTIPYFSHVMYIDRDGSIKSAGFLIRYYNGIRPDEKRFLLKLNGRFNTIYPIFYHIFYKSPDIFDKKTKKSRKAKKYEKILKTLKI